MVVNEWSFLILKQNSSLIFLSIHRGENTSPQPPGLPMKDLHQGTQKGPFLNPSGRSELALTKASARREGRNVLLALDLVPWDRHSDLDATEQGSSLGSCYIFTHKSFFQNLN